MGWRGRLWNLLYLGRAPWDIGGPRPELVRLVERGRLPPCRAIDLGCGIGETVIYLAQQGFDASGVDIASRAIAKARRKAQAAGVSPTFLVADVTDLKGMEGPFDLVVDNGCLHSLAGERARQRYVETLMRLTRPGSHYFLRCFVREPRSRLKLAHTVLLEAGEVDRRFAGAFEIEHFTSTAGEAPWGLSDATAVYWMRRKRG